MDKSENHAAERNGKESGKSLGDLLRALNSFQDSLGEMMDENVVAEFTFKDRNIVNGSGYRIGIPDGFKTNLQSFSASGQLRDFLAWIPSENERDDFALADADETKVIELVHNGNEDSNGKSGYDLAKEAYDDMVGGGVNQSKLSLNEYSFGKITGGFIRRVMSSMCCNYYIFLELNGRVLKLRVIFNNKYSTESMDTAINSWLDTLKWAGNEEAETARDARLREDEERAKREEEERKAKEEAERRAKEEEERRLAEEARLKAEEEARKAEEEERKAKEEEERRLAEEARLKAEEEARKAEEERKAKEEEERRLAEEARLKAEEEARKAEEERKAKEEEERRLAEEARLKAEEEARKAEEERLAKEEEERRLAEEARLKAEEEARKAEEERLAKEEAERKAEEERLATLAKVEAARKIASDKAREEAARLEIEKAEKEKLENERAAREAEQKAKEESARIAKEAEEQAKADAIRRAKEEKEAAERAAAEKAVREKAEAERLEFERKAKAAAEEAAAKEAERVAAAKAAAAQYEIQQAISSQAVATKDDTKAMLAEKSATAWAEDVEAERLAEKQRRDELRQRERREEEQQLKLEEEKRHAQLKKHAEDLRLQEDEAIGKLKAEKEKLVQQRVEIAAEINDCMLEKAEIEKQYNLERQQFLQVENQVNATLFNAQGRKKDLEAQAQESENRYTYKEQTERKRLLKLKDDLRTAFAAVELAGEIEAIFREKAASGNKKKALLYKQKMEDRENAEKELDSIKNQFEVAQINSKATIEEHQKAKEKFDKDLAAINETIEENQSVIVAKKESMEVLKDRSKAVDDRRAVANKKIKDIEDTMRDIDIKIREEEAKH
ncbi:MAG: hypothetical protein K6G24_09920 [Lachnospiraceae bacterium]|nr:hypothetical protein [Lachnospiraceae bacterium]